MAHTPVSHCERCGYRLDAATGVTCNGEPKPGDISICLKCGEIGCYDNDMAVRVLTEAEREGLQRNEIWPLIREAQKLIHLRREMLRAIRN